VSVLCAHPPADYDRWRAAEVDRQLSLKLADKREKAAAKGKPIEKVKLTKADRERIEKAIPSDLFAALHMDTSALRKQGWSAPPGTRWLTYRRPALRQPTPRIQASTGPAPTAMRFALSGAVLPRLTDALRLGEAVRGALGNSQLPVFHGKDAEGRPLRGHDHAFFLPESSGARGPITHLSLFAQRGFGQDERAAIENLVSRDIRMERDASHSMKLTLIGAGQAAELGATGAPLFAESKVWRSVTPFVPTRHPKRKRDGTPKLDADGRAIGSPVHDLLRLLELAGLPRVESVQPTEGMELGGRLVRWLDFYRWRARRGGGARGDSRGHGFRIVFAEPVRGPLALGYAAHFGLGIFAPESP